MNALDELQANLLAVAERSAAVKAACANEESAKQYLILPFFGALGYDYSDPFEVQPEYTADFREGMPDRVDYAIMREGKPIIAVECKKVGANLSVNRGQLRAYYTALRSVRLGVLTDGLKFEFFVDCEIANVMDSEPFLTLDLEAVRQGPIPADVLDALLLMARPNFDPETIAEAAEIRLVAKRVRAELMQEVREPSDEFCRLLLQRVGIKNVRRSSIQSRYSALVRAAIEDALVIPVLERLRAPQRQGAEDNIDADEGAERIVTTERELAVYRYICRRLAFLSTSEQQFAAIEDVKFRDYIGKFAVYYQNIRKGRLLDFIEGANGYDKFVFPEPFGEVVTNNVAEIDEPLRRIFFQRVRDAGGPQLAEVKKTAIVA